MSLVDSWHFPMLTFLKLVAKMGEEKVKEMLGLVLEESYAKAQVKQKAEGYIRLERGFATVPLPGIDVPFHSRYLWAGVMPFRACMPRFLFYTPLTIAHQAPRPF